MTINCFWPICREAGWLILLTLFGPRATPWISEVSRGCRSVDLDYHWGMALCNATRCACGKVGDNHSSSGVRCMYNVQCAMCNVLLAIVVCTQVTTLGRADYWNHNSGSLTCALSTSLLFPCFPSCPNHHDSSAERNSGHVSDRQTGILHKVVPTYRIVRH